MIAIGIHFINHLGRSMPWWNKETSWQDLPWAASLSARPFHSRGKTSMMMLLMLRSLLRLQRPWVQPLSIHIEALIKDLLEVEALCEENDKFDLPFISYPETKWCSGQFSIQGTSFNNVGATCKYQSIVKVNNIKFTTSKVRVCKLWSINEYKKALRIAIEDVQEVLPWLIYPPMMFINLIDWRPGNPKRIQRLSSKDKAASCSPNAPHSSNNNGSNPNGICSIHVFNPMPILKIIISDNPSACNLFNCFSN